MSPQSPLILGIETSCDDTACALLDGAGRVVSSVVSSQLEAHRPFGGVVPEIASREHLTNWPAVASEALARAGLGLDRVDAVAATRGPGLVGSLLVGLAIGRAIAFARGVPFFGVHHLEGHLWSPFLDPEGGPAEAPPERLTAVVVSGGHSCLYAVEGRRVTTVAETRDDAMGEVFDKVGKRLGLPYPQGPRVDELAEAGATGRFRFAVPRMSDGSLDLSFSGLKSETLRALQRLAEEGIPIELESWPEGEPPPELLDLLAAFRRAAVDQIADRLERHHEAEPLERLAVSGGAAANRLLRRELESWCTAHGVALRLVPLAFSGDNAAMIAHAALLRHRHGEPDDPLSTTAASRIPIGA